MYQKYVLVVQENNPKLNLEYFIESVLCLIINNKNTLMSNMYTKANTQNLFKSTGLETPYTRVRLTLICISAFLYSM